MRTIKQMLKGAPNVRQADMAKAVGVPKPVIGRCYRAARNGDFLASLFVLTAARASSALVGGGLQSDLEDFMCEAPEPELPAFLTRLASPSGRALTRITEEPETAF